MNIKLSSLEETKKQLLRLTEDTITNESGWSSYQVFVHCAKTIEYSMKGYPLLKPAIIRVTIGKIAILKFLKQGYMNHNLSADVPGSPIIENTGTFQQGIERLIESIEKFQLYSGELYPHLLFGKLKKEEYDKYFSMHIADHLSVNA